MSQFQHYQGDPGDDQAVFDFLASHLLTQGVACYSRTLHWSKPVCVSQGYYMHDVKVYRDNRYRLSVFNCRSAVGALLTEGECEKFQKMGRTDLLEGSPLRALLTQKGFNIALVSAFEFWHDDEYFGPRYWRGHFRKIAENFGLNDKACDLKE